MKAKKLEELLLRQLAGRIRPERYATQPRQKISGEDLLLSGHSEVDGQPIDPEETYLIRVPLILQVNHHRRLKRAMARSGVDGVIHYLIPKFVKAHEEERLRQTFKKIRSHAQA
jgi:hypothetical protein